MATRITDNSAISRDVVWALLRYFDGSEFCFQTTLNPAILKQYGITLSEGCLARLDKKYLYRGQMIYRQFPYDGASISLWDSLHYTDEASLRLHDFI